MIPVVAAGGFVTTVAVVTTIGAGMPTPSTAGLAVVASVRASSLACSTAASSTASSMLPLATPSQVFAWVAAAGLMVLCQATSLSSSSSGG